MTDQNPTPSPYEPPSGSSGSGGDTGATPTSGAAGGYEPPSTGSGYDPNAGGGNQAPTTGGGSIYESSAYQPPGTPPPPGGSPYGQPPGGQQYPPPYQAPVTPVAPGKNNTMLFGILGIVLGVVCCAPLGILFGWLSMNEAKKTNSDATLGKVAFWLGIALTAVAVIGGLIALCAGVFSSNNSNY
ncbi:hypothetical protein HDA40_005078 [Hamadaea flava]|uniref:DUF4190 domain-containing protein n=1 Tax=Hamadaea flava TaxID=1742688 RepID=A0ABV8LIC9_9ACTN|nr:hypothetical protein [Hamadaea flava]MCP2326571.1 hypothetical protein [Hamadaea flava]